MHLDPKPRTSFHHMFSRILKLRMCEFFHQIFFVLFFCKVEVIKIEKNANVTDHFHKRDTLQPFDLKIVEKYIRNS